MASSHTRANQTRQAGQPHHAPANQQRRARRQRSRKPDIFTRITSKVSLVLGHAWVFVTAVIVLVIWGLSGPLLGFSDTWQLIINTSTTIVTFLMVFIIQNTQNRDNMAMNIKMDAMMKKLGVSDTELLEAEEESDKDLEKRKEQMQHGKTSAAQK